MSTSKKRPDEPTFLLDRTHGRKKLAGTLRKVGIKVEVHFDHFGPEEDDDSWIPKCVAKGWIIISGDQAIESDPINRKAVEDSCAKVFITAENNSKAEEWAAAIIVGRRKLARIVDRNNGPFFVSIDKHASGHVSSVRYVGSGSPKPMESEPQTKSREKAPPLTEPAAQVIEEAQQELFQKDKISIAGNNAKKAS